MGYATSLQNDGVVCPLFFLTFLAMRLICLLNLISDNIYTQYGDSVDNNVF